MAELAPPAVNINAVSSLGLSEIHSSLIKGRERNRNVFAILHYAVRVVGWRKLIGFFPPL
ncbi:hypothetical protein J6590_104120 [Homalodisca vitripennis]|nr:hypothetical protein J6590_104120 [Homalodisca vitripennis]